MPLTSKDDALIDSIIKRYPRSRSAIMPLLHLAQARDGLAAPLDPDAGQVVAVVVPLGAEGRNRVVRDAGVAAVVVRPELPGQGARLAGPVASAVGGAAARRHGRRSGATRRASCANSTT